MGEFFYLFKSLFSCNLSFQLSSAFFLIVLLFHGLNPRFNPKLLTDMQTFLLGKVFSKETILQQVSVLLCSMGNELRSM